MIVLKSQKDIEKMRPACVLSAEVLQLAGELIKPGISTKELDNLLHKYIVKNKGVPSFLGYNGFPGSACISLNDTIIHGIPSKDIIIKDGDIVSVDVGAIVNGFHGDNAYTYLVGEVDEETKRLCKVTEESLYKAIGQAQVGNRLGDIGHAVQSLSEGAGFSVVREFVGHGVGRNLHEEPEVPNFGTPGRGQRLVAGMTIAIEPMINMGTAAITQQSDGWTIKTRDHKPSAHYEHTILITNNGPIVLTKA